MEHVRAARARARPRAGRAARRRLRPRRPGGDLDLGREGGHSARRVAHAKDTTGRENRAGAARRASPSAPTDITILADHMAVDLLTSRQVRRPRRGASAPTSSTRRPARSRPSWPRATVLATGGAGKVYLYTTNPDVATGDGVAMAYRAGARVANMEFYPVPPHLPLPPAGQELPHQRGAARRGRHPAAARRRDLHGALPPHEGRSPRATWWPAPSTPSSSAPATTTSSST